MIRITSRKDGFIRGGVRHPAEPTAYPDKFFGKAQLEAIEAEPMLVVEHIDGPAPGEIATTSAPDKMTVPQLKELLDKLKIDYPADAKKVDLVALVEKNTAEPPKE